MNKKKYSYTNLHKNYTSRPPHYSKYYGIPLIIIMALVPLIMYLYTYPMNLSKYPWASTDPNNADIFLFYKQVIFLITAAIMLVLVLIKIKKEITALKKLKLFIPIIIYGLFTFLSTLFSEYRSYGFNGIFDQFESTFTILGYCLILFYTYIYIKEESAMEYILHYFTLGIFIMVILGILQFSGHDFFMTSLGKKLYLPRSEWTNLSSYGLTFEKNRVFLTLFNPNYVGVYVSMLIPFILCLLLCVKSLKKKAMYGILLIGLIIALIGSNSKTSLICIVITFPFMLYFFRRKLTTNKKVLLIAIAVAITALLVIIATSFNFIRNTVQSVIRVEKSNPNITNIETDSLLSITYKGNTMKLDIIKNDSQYTVGITDEQNISLASHTSDEGLLMLDDQRFQGITARIGQYNNTIAVQITIDGAQWNFSNQLGDDTFYYINKYGRFDKIVNAKSAVFTGYENFASNRGYIWSRSIPLVSGYLLFGSGANSFAFAFPQNDYLAFSNAGLGTDLLTKPHSYFLQTAIQSGMAALIAFLVFYIMYFVWSIRLYRKSDFDDIFSQVGIGALMASLGFLIAGIANDSSICTTPIFWALLGLGIASNSNIQSRKKE